MTGNQLDVIIDKKPIRALVDSGASFSVISDKYRRFLKKVLFADAKSVMLKVADVLLSNSVTILSIGSYLLTKNN
ncbi:hypothetical protein TNCV_1253241 [Trichonephila clavipes]|nr:hypothetical protein TNCV_1253241 [Trichonephila clavipes]